MAIHLHASVATYKFFKVGDNYELGGPIIMPARTTGPCAAELFALARWLMLMDFINANKSKLGVVMGKLKNNTTGTYLLALGMFVTSFSMVAHGYDPHELAANELAARREQVRAEEARRLAGGVRFYNSIGRGDLARQLEKAQEARKYISDNNLVFEFDELKHLQQQLRNAENNYNATYNDYLRESKRVGAGGDLLRLKDLERNVDSINRKARQLSAEIEALYNRAPKLRNSIVSYLSVIGAVGVAATLGGVSGNAEAAEAANGPGEVGTAETAADADFSSKSWARDPAR